MKKHPATPKELKTITDKMHDDYRRMAWTLASTGMRMKEYWGEWSAFSNYIQIRGTKTAGAQRTVPLWWGVARPACWYGIFRKELAVASEGLMTPYDLRRTYANWLEDAGIPRTRRRLYLGHGAKDTTDLYEWRELRAHLEADAETLTEWVDAQLRAESHAKSHVRAIK